MRSPGQHSSSNLMTAPWPSTWNLRQPNTAVHRLIAESTSGLKAASVTLSEITSAQGSGGGGNSSGPTDDADSGSGSSTAARTVGSTAFRVFRSCRMVTPGRGTRFATTGLGDFEYANAPALDSDCTLLRRQVTPVFYSGSLNVKHRSPLGLLARDRRSIRIGTLISPISVQRTSGVFLLVCPPRRSSCRTRALQRPERHRAP